MIAAAIKQAGDFAAFFHPKTGNGVLYHIKNLQLPLTHSISWGCVEFSIVYVFLDFLAFSIQMRACTLLLYLQIQKKIMT